MKPLWAVDSWYLPIQDEAEYGILLYVEQSLPRAVPAELNGFEPGDWVEVSGVVGRRGGMPVILPRDIRRSGHSSAPLPVELRMQDLNSFRYLGLLVTTQSRVIKTGENGGGDLVLLGNESGRVGVFLPKMRRNAGIGLDTYRTGDMVRATGIATQYCMVPPYDRSFQVLLGDRSGLLVVEKAWLIPPAVFLVVLFAIMALLGLWSLREHHLTKARRRLRMLHAVGEEVVGSASPGEMIRKLAALISKDLRISGVGVFASNRQTNALDSFFGEGSASEYSGMDPLAAPILEAAATAFRGKTLLAVRNCRKSPLFSKERPAPRSAVFVPMYAQTEVIGVLELESAARSRGFPADELEALQHLANQVAAALKIHEQSTLREQLFRSEKLASAGQLMSGIANELRPPLDSIVGNLEALRDLLAGSDALLSTVTGDAHRALEIVQRLMAFSPAEQNEAESFDLNEMLTCVAELESEGVRSRRISVRRRLSNQSLIAFGSRDQLAQVLLNLLVYAEQSLAETRGPSEIRITSALLARRAIIEVSWPAPNLEAKLGRSASEPIGKTGLSLEICHGIVQSHGGELRVSKSGNEVRFEIDLPVMETRQRKEFGDRADQAGRGQLTVMVVEPEASSQLHVISTFAALGHRVVPVTSAEEGADLAERMRFDLVVCALRLPGLSWTGLLERVRNQVGGIVLLADAYDPNLLRNFQSDDVHVLTKPLDSAEVKQICERIQAGVQQIAIAG